MFNSLLQSVTCKLVCDYVVLDDCVWMCVFVSLCIVCVCVCEIVCAPTWLCVCVFSSKAASVSPTVSRKVFEGSAPVYRQGYLLQL